jgi:hypothetical protein
VLESENSEEGVEVDKMWCVEVGVETSSWCGAWLQDGVIVAPEELTL